ncbi:hypothetical protein L7F22_026369 [Adiantum nelumboides]|nr:hypothetical protein [Adiantum nelumboides]
MMRLRQGGAWEPAMQGLLLKESALWRLPAAKQEACALSWCGRNRSAPRRSWFKSAGQGEGSRGFPDRVRGPLCPALLLCRPNVHEGLLNFAEGPTLVRGLELPLLGFERELVIVAFGASQRRFLLGGFQKVSIVMGSTGCCSLDAILFWFDDISCRLLVFQLQWETCRHVAYCQREASRFTGSYDYQVC